MVRILIILAFVSSLTSAFSQEIAGSTNLAGVYQGKTLFIQNPYNSALRLYCIEKILVNNVPLNLSYKMSAIALDFDNFDLYTPINISIIHGDKICSPLIINPEAVLFHTVFRFSSVSLSDSSLTWSTKGERGIGTFELEKLTNGIWIAQETITSEGVYEAGSYASFPVLDEGANKYRIKYNYPRGSRARYLYSQEIDYDYYPEPVEFKPHSAKTRLYLSRSTSYEIYDGNSKLVFTGQGIEIDVTVLRQGQYVIYFNGKDPGTFIKE